LFFAKLVLAKRGKPPKVIFQLNVVHNLPTQLPQKLLDEKVLLFFVQASLMSHECHKNGLLALMG
jgi:hypothetical protein